MSEEKKAHFTLADVVDAATGKKPLVDPFVSQSIMSEQSEHYLDLNSEPVSHQSTMIGRRRSTAGMLCEAMDNVDLGDICEDGLLDTASAKVAVSSSTRNSKLMAKSQFSRLDTLSQVATGKTKEDKEMELRKTCANCGWTCLVEGTWEQRINTKCQKCKHFFYSREEREKRKTIKGAMKAMKSVKKEKEDKTTSSLFKLYAQRAKDLL